MTHAQIKTLLDTLKIPVAYDHFIDDKDLQPPFIAYREVVPSTFKADNKTYFKNNEFEVEVITEKKDLVLEGQIEKLFDENDIPYDKEDEIWDNDEKIYHNIYII